MGYFACVIRAHDMDKNPEIEAEHVFESKDRTAQPRLEEFNCGGGSPSWYSAMLTDVNVAYEAVRARNGAKAAIEDSTLSKAASRIYDTFGGSKMFVAIAC